MELRQLNYFVQLSSCLNYREAARTLFITPQALSRSIRSLEDELGTPLFERNTRNVELTTAGKAFLAEITPSLRRLEQAAEDLKNNHAVEKTIRFGLCPGGAFFLPMEKIYAFQDSHPNMRLETLELPDSDVEKGLLEGSLNVGFLTPKLNENRFLAFPFLNHMVYVIVSRKNPLASKDKITFSDLTDAPLITIHGHTNYIERVIQVCREKTGGCPRIHLESFDPLTVCKMVAEDRGITFLSQARMDQLRAMEHELVAIPWPDKESNYSLQVVLPKNVPVTDLMQDFIRCLITA